MINKKINIYSVMYFILLLILFLILEMCNLILFFIFNLLLLECTYFFINISYQHTTNNLLDFIPKNNNVNNSINTINNNSINNINMNEINKLKEQIEKLNMNISKLQKENNELKIENNELRNKNNIIQNDLKNKLQTIKKYEEDIKNLKNSLNLKDGNIFNLNNQINDLTSQINNLQLNNNKTKNKFGLDEIVSVLIQSIDQKVNIPLFIPKSELFVRLEEQLYEEYPEYKDVDNIYFTVNGRKIKRFRSIEENNLKNKDKILLNIYEC